MPKRADIDSLNDIKEAIRRISIYIENLSYEEFLKDLKTEDAVVRNLEIIGEAAKNISEELKREYSQIPWKDLAGVRDRLIHHYFGVNFDIVWNVAKKELPGIILQVEEILKIG
jgi:uncharacterized protein with HEPN domain